MSDEHKRNAKIIAEAIAELEKDPEGMALAFLNVYLHSKPKRETPDWIVGPLDEVERIAKENGIDVKDLNITPVSKLEEE
ncbi:MAG: hypothetical protein ACK528_08720 [Alphaproteobacteria bacterium]|jgi:hypothetical protein